MDMANGMDLDEFDGDQAVVKLTKPSTGKTMLIQVEDDAGMGSVEFTSPDDVINRDLPPLPEEGAFE